MPITLQEPFRAIFYTPFYAAFALGAFKEEGLDVQLFTPESWAAAAVNAKSGAVDVSWGGPMRVMLLRDQDPDVRLVCFSAVVMKDPFHLIGRRPNPNFRFADLMEVRFGSVSEVPTPWMCLQDDLRRAGLDPGALARVADRSMPDNAAALRAGELDVVQVFEPFATELVESGAGHIWWSQASRGPTSYTSFYANDSTIAARRPELLKMTRAIARTLRWVHGHDAAALADLVKDYFAHVPRELMVPSVDRYKRLGVWSETPILPREAFDRLKGALLSGGLIRADKPFEVCVDNSLAEEVLRGGL